jgi:hypothetical protein
MFPDVFSGGIDQALVTAPALSVADAHQNLAINLNSPFRRKVHGDGTISASNITSWC